MSADPRPLDGADSWQPPPEVQLEGPAPLGQLPLRGKAHGAYVVSVGPVVAAIGAGGGRSGHFAGRLKDMASLGHHRATRRVLCAAYCYRAWPQVWWMLTEPQEETLLETQLKATIGKPELLIPACHRAEPIRRALLEAASSDPWAAGYIEAVFDIGERLQLLGRTRFAPIWEKVGIPPGPWAGVLADSTGA